MYVFPTPQYIACIECGATVLRTNLDEHECDQERRVDYQLLLLRPTTARFEYDLQDWLQSKAGQFEALYAEVHRPNHDEFEANALYIPS